MSSFQLSVTPNRRAAARFVNLIRGQIQKAYAESPEIRQTDIARALGVHRSVINRQIRGFQDMSIGRAGEIIWALGREPKFDLIKPELIEGDNHAPPIPGAAPTPVPLPPIMASTSGSTVPVRALELQSV